MTDTPAPVAQPLSAEDMEAIEAHLRRNLDYGEDESLLQDILTALGAVRLDAARSVPDNAALRAFLRHKDGCASGWGMAVLDERDASCDCGLRAALAAAPTGSSFSHENADPASPSGSSPVPAGLDVERLARALTANWRAVSGNPVRRTPLVIARMLAADYAANPDGSSSPADCAECARQERLLGADPREEWVADEWSRATPHPHADPEEAGR